ncbi:MAG: hypothetical protein FWG40_10765 [Peptococcaceae bacterium]|nr:hypothetical protein [Peptococcaceae bacterium]
MSDNFRDRGSFTIEATLAISVFMFCFVSFISLALIAKAESTTQYAIDQVAKEMSRYYYVADRVLANDSGLHAIEDMDEAIESVVNLSNTANEAVDHVSGGFEDFSDALSTIGNDIDSISTAAKNMQSSFAPILDDPVGMVKLLIRQAGNEVVNKVIAQMMCRSLTPKYITSNGNADETLKRMGVVNGLNGLDFRMSTFMADDRSINIVLVYQVKVTGFGIIDKTLPIMQTASTAAWIANPSARPLTQVLGAPNWSDNGAAANGIRDENTSILVAPGQDFDMYDPGSNTFTNIHSMNVFTSPWSHYANATGDPDSPENYTVKEDKIKGQVLNYANALNNDMFTAGNLLMADGSTATTAKHGNGVIIMAVPEATKANPGNTAALNRIAEQIKTETGVTVQWDYR